MDRSATAPQPAGLRAVPLRLRVETSFSADESLSGTPETIAGHHGREAAALFAESVSFRIPHPPGIPWVPEVDSAEGMRTFFELLQTHVQAKEFDLRQVIAEGDDVVLIGRMISGVKKTGRDIDTAFALHTTVRDGRITRYHLYEDYAVAEAYFGD
ncbi:nuclear transport factor 2 family protein [Streptomyces sp. NBC_01546]|uniref:nuclear transport factor 2 family protein n=1 Tax=Streptomyces sp. NBC_01546 TaxID=2975872 RepID=UPI00386E6504